MTTPNACGDAKTGLEMATVTHIGVQPHGNIRVPIKVIVHQDLNKRLNILARSRAIIAVRMMLKFCNFYNYAFLFTIYVLTKITYY